MKRYRPTNPKVVAATAGASAGAVISGFINWGIDELFYNGPSAPDVPDPVTGFVYLVVTAGLAFGAGWVKRSEP